METGLNPVLSSCSIFVITKCELRAIQTDIEIKKVGGNMPTLVKEITHSDTTVETNVLAGTACAQVGASGSVIMAFLNSDGTSSASCRATGTNGSEVSIIPDGSNAIVATELLGSDHFIYRTGGLQPGSAILLTVTPASAGTSVIAVRTY